jgi:hypothetical protein
MASERKFSLSPIRAAGSADKRQHDLSTSQVVRVFGMRIDLMQIKAAAGGFV